MQIEVEKEVTLRFTFSAVETDVDLHNEFLVMGVSSGVLEMGTDVLLEIETMAYVFQETGSVVCDFQEMGTVACAFPETATVACAFSETATVACAFLEKATVVCAFLETATVACAFLEMGNVACAFPEMGNVACAFPEMEIDVYLMKTCVGQATFDVQEMVTSLTHELANDDGEEKVTFVTQTMVIFCEEEISVVKMGMDTLAMKVNLSLNKVISFLENAFGEKQSV